MVPDLEGHDPLLPQVYALGDGALLPVVDVQVGPVVATRHVGQVQPRLEAPSAMQLF